MIDALFSLLSDQSEEAQLLFAHLRGRNKPFFNASDIASEFESLAATEEGSNLRGSPAEGLIRVTQEVVVGESTFFLAVRARVAIWHFLELDLEEQEFLEITPADYLTQKEGVVGADPEDQPWLLEFDLGPFENGFPRPTETRSIGQGGHFLKRNLAASTFFEEERGMEGMLGFLSTCQVQGAPLMVGDEMEDVDQLREALRGALQLLDGEDREEGWQAHGNALQELGFEAGWGRTTSRIRETMSLLSEILEAPSPDTLEEFLARVPMVFSIAILSPHGYFGQAGVLGKPDTGGQVVYILDQVRALEKEMKRSIHEVGLDVDPNIVVLSRLIPESDGTACNQRLEPVEGTEHSRILRVPLRTAEGEVIPQWISRFDIWPYLERYALEAEEALREEMGCAPDFILGNYSDGNLVASLMARRMGVVQCNIAHALEKTKYKDSDLNWKALDDQYHFSSQFTADLFSMNSADFIITSSFQEIAGTEETVGQYESHQAFTMPGLFRVVSGIDAFDPKFNIVPPGADPEVFFPFSSKEERDPEIQAEVAELIFGEPGEETRGKLTDRGKPILFAMSRLDVIKNTAGLVDWFGRNTRLRELANLVIVGGYVDPEQSADRDERSQIEGMHELFDKHGLDQGARWVIMQTDKNRVGEFYRCVADTGGAFVQPALFEGFGLTVVEAMSSGLPVFATRFGGPLEIVQDGLSGFHIDPNQGDEATARMVAFLERTQEEASYWGTLSGNAMERVRTSYNWGNHAKRLLTLSRMYGFWKFLTESGQQERRRYLDMFYAQMVREQAKKVPLS
jgi:sucrose synthase